MGILQSALQHGACRPLKEMQVHYDGWAKVREPTMRVPVLQGVTQRCYTRSSRVAGRHAVSIT
jgi:hypothetical protein